MDNILLEIRRRLDLDILNFKLNKEFEIKNLGNASRILGIEIIRNREEGKLLITQ